MRIAIERYNAIMESIGLEFCTIGRPYSAKETVHFTLRDMVAEVDYHFSNYFDPYHESYRMTHSDDEFERNLALRDRGEMRYFLSSYAKYVHEMPMYMGHCSKYDTPASEFLWRVYGNL